MRALKAACHAAARETGRRVERVKLAGVTPSFHTVTLVGKGDPVAVLGHVVVPLIALARPRRWDGEATVSFVEVPEVAAALERAGVEVLRAGELNREVEEASLVELDPAELRQIAYWKPRTLGEVLFNFWD